MNSTRMIMLESPCIWLVGCGNMGGAMLRGWLADGLDPARITVVDPAMPDVPAGVRCVAQAPADEGAPARLLLGIKPQALDDVAPQIAPLLGHDTLLISILAGVELASLHARFLVPRHIVRAMPNMPASIGKGVTVLFASSPDEAIRAQAGVLMTPLGQVEWIADEALFDAVTAVSGCGPAFLFRFIDAIAQAGTVLGLAEDQAMRLALATVDGAAQLAAESGEGIDSLADRVASPGGATRAGLNVFDENQALIALLKAAIAASARRSAEMSAAARG